MHRTQKDNKILSPVGGAVGMATFRFETAEPTGFSLSLMEKYNHYFQHDFDPDPVNDLKMQALISEYGLFGYGLYWRLVELLHADKKHGNRIERRPYVFLAIAKQMSTHVQQNATTAQQIEDCVNFMINTCELLQSDGNFIYSNRVFYNVNRKNEISELRRRAGIASASVRQNRTHVQQPSTNKKEERRKKKGENKDKDDDFKIVFPFDSERFLSMWDHWKDYKKVQHRFTFKSKKSEQAQLKELSNLSSANEDSAIAIIEQSIAQGWKGLFQLKNNNNATSANRQPTATGGNNADYKTKLAAKMEGYSGNGQHAPGGNPET